ncbi:Peptidoglycan endopeptidase LytF precursor [Clostridium sp. C105KSO15]|nr:Peptidoglycan endopeptidase LytF precursor [Clostridium sp. C105KSO15]
MANCPQGLFPYTIRRGDTLWMIAQRYYTSVAAIRAANPGLNPQNLTVGQTICVPSRRAPRPPVTPPPSRCPVGLRTHVVQRNDSLWLIAQRYCTTVETILALNRGLTPGNLRVGQVLLIPAGYNLSNLPFWFRSQDVQDISPMERTDSNGMTYYPEETYSFTADSGDTQ